MLRNRREGAVGESLAASLDRAYDTRMFLNLSMGELMTYRPLPMQVVALEDLLLDLANYRIPVPSANERQALTYLYAAEEVHETARMILRDGYFDNEVPIVFRDTQTGAGKFVVLEGNRRVSALKLLDDPTLLPAHEGPIRGLLKRYAEEADNLPKAIRVLVAPTKEMAARHIARLHTTQPKRPWSRDQQATYYYSLLDPTMSVADLRQAYPGVSVPRFIRMAVMRRFLSGVKFADRSLHEFVRGNELKMSAFEYAYRHPEISDAIGVAFDSDGLLQPTTAKPETIGAQISAKQVRAAEFLMGEFRAERLNTRSEELRRGTDAFDAFLASLDTAVNGPGERGRASAESSNSTHDSPGDSQYSGDGPKSTPSAESTSTNSGVNQSRSGSGGQQAPGRGPNHPATSDKFVLTGLDYASWASSNLQHRYHELRRLTLSETPVAAAMLLRAVLESSIKFHFEGTTESVSGELKACMAQVRATYGSDRSLRPAIDSIYSGNADKCGSVTWFNYVAHNPDAMPSAVDLHAAMSLLHPVLRRLLREPEAKATS